jgi:hypothetical protein
MKISAQHGSRWRLSEDRTVPRRGRHAHRGAPSCSPEFLIANPRLEMCTSCSKQRTAAESNRERIAIRPRNFLPATRHSLILRPPSAQRSLITSTTSNRNCRSDQDRHPERPSGVEGVSWRHSASGRSRQISNRNSRSAGFHSTCSKHTIKQNSNRNKNSISAISPFSARHRFPSPSLPPCLAATRPSRYNLGSHIEVNQP